MKYKLYLIVIHLITKVCLLFACNRDCILKVSVSLLSSEHCFDSFEMRIWMPQYNYNYMFINPFLFSFFKGHCGKAHIPLENSRCLRI